MTAHCVICGRFFSGKKGVGRYKVKTCSELCRSINFRVTIRLASLKWKQKHPDKCRAYDKKYRQKNREKECARVRKWQQEHPKQHRANCIKWSQKNLDKHRANIRKWHRKRRKERFFQQINNLRRVTS